MKLAAGREQRTHLLGLTSSKDVLEKLKAVHQVSQLERVQSLLSEFHIFKVKDSIDISASRLTQLQLQIAAADQAERPSDSIKKTVLLHGLPDEYQPAVFALKAAGLARITFDDMVQRLREVETARTGQRDLIHNEARVANRSTNQFNNNWRNQSTQKTGYTPRSQAGIECYHCHKKGHMKRECRNLHRKPDQLQQANKVQDTAWTISYKGTFAHQAGYGKPDQQEWILDSGCTTHMTFDPGHFYNFTKHDGTVTVADGKTLQVQGGGTIEVPIQGRMT